MSRLGSCCSSCASAKPCCGTKLGGLGDLTPPTYLAGLAALAALVWYFGFKKKKKTSLRRRKNRR